MSGCSTGAGILGIGMFVPDRVVTNADLESMVDTSDEWIFTRTGIRERRIASDEETTSSMGTAAAAAALADAGVEPHEVDLVLCATGSGDYVWPATACRIQNALGARHAAAFDLSAACSGFVYGLEVAGALIASGAMRHVLVVGSERLSRQVDWTDRSTCVLFGDGAGAVLIGPCTGGEGLLASVMGTDGSHVESLLIPAGGTFRPTGPNEIADRLDKVHMRGAEVFRFAVKIMGEACVQALERAGLTSDDVSLFIPHQANIRIIRSAAARMGLEADRVFTNVDRYGNTSAASVPIALCEAVRRRLVSKGDVLVFVGFGAGLTWGANVVRWSRDETRVTAGTPGGAACTA